LACEQHEWQQAKTYFATSLNLLRQAGSPWDIAVCLEKWAKALLAQGQALRATRFVSKATGMCEDLDIAPQAGVFQRLKDAIQIALTEESFQAAWEQGERLSLDDLLSTSDATPPSHRNGK
jgi:hypothetical protein